MIWQVVLAILCASAVARSDYPLIEADPGLVVNSYSTHFSYVTQVPNDQINVTITNHKNRPADYFLLLVRNDRKPIAFAHNPDYEIELQHGKGLVRENWKDYVLYQQIRIVLKKKLEVAETRSFSIQLYFRGFGDFYPKEISLFEEQKVKFTMQRFPASPYTLEALNVRMTSGDDWMSPSFKSTRAWEPLQPTTEESHIVLNAHYTQSKMTSRYLEISHWGNIYVSEQVKLHNRAAKLVGEYSTIDYNGNRKDTGKNSFRDYTIELPRNSFGLFYRDEIGNISTGFVKPQEDGRYLVTLFPRFSLLGNWNLTWDISYNVPSTEFLSVNSKNEYKFEYSLHSLFSTLPHDRYTLKIALPEGAKLVSEEFTGIKPKRIKEELSFSYLNFFGRPTRVYFFDNYYGSANPDAKLTIRYEFQPSSLWIAPLYLVSALGLAFAIYLLISRIDLNFELAEDPAAEQSHEEKPKTE